ncbi:MAG: YkvA family protein [Chryseolinea sp.]
MKNRFFEIALGQAARLAGKSGRMLMLITRFGTKMRDVNWSSIQREQVKLQLFTLGRLARAYALGHYREVPWKTMLVVLAAVIYFVNPLDLVPDVIPVAGLTDDFAVLVWVYNSLGTEIEKFQAWESSRARPL